MELIYDPRNKYLVMEDNPIDSIDPMHGVPDKFIGIATKLAMLRVANRTEEEIEIEDEDSNEEEPMIKPSDMM